DTLTVRFRVGAVYKNAYINVYYDDVRVSHMKRQIMAPGEMEKAVLKKADLLGKNVQTITVEVAEA
ncbi:MAG: pyridine nucleotide-disulfide oxidoreductase, partial [Clostridia bacterium]|nr:pyridine nucleotide-disulfide oxidoreductase [Clostridia bacterium]